MIIVNLRAELELHL